MKALALSPLAILIAGFLTSNAQTASQKPQPPMCTFSDLSLGTDDEGSVFHGMSHGGTLLVLRNIGPKACRVAPFPQITFADASQNLTAKGVVDGSRFMHPGPIVLPVIVAPGAELTATLRWVSGEVFDDNLCIHPTRLTLAIGGETQSTPFTAQICSERTKGVTYTMTRFAVDPVYKP